MKALVCGASGFIGRSLVRRLKSEGFWVRGVSRRPTSLRTRPADEHIQLDLREAESCRIAVATEGEPFHRVYQLAADMGGIGYIESGACDIMRSNLLINVNMTRAAANARVRRYFFASSVCIYRNMQQGERPLSEYGAYPAHPDNEYGWEKLFAERMVTAHAQEYGFSARIGRLGTAYGPGADWRGGREKVVSALCRKVSEAPSGESIEVWGDGSAVRSFLFIDDMVDAIYRFTESSLEGPVNIGSPEYVTVGELLDIVRRVSGKHFTVNYVAGPVGVQARNFSHERIASIGWQPKKSLVDGVAATYGWINQQVTAVSGPRELTVA